MHPVTALLITLVNISIFLFTVMIGMAMITEGRNVKNQYENDL